MLVLEPTERSRKASLHTPDGFATTAVPTARPPERPSTVTLRCESFLSYSPKASSGAPVAARRVQSSRDLLSRDPTPLQNKLTKPWGGLVVKGFSLALLGSHPPRPSSGRTYTDRPSATESTPHLHALTIHLQL